MCRVEGIVRTVAQLQERGFERARIIQMFAALGRTNDFKVPGNCSYEDNLTEEVDCEGCWQYLKKELVVDECHHFNGRTFSIALNCCCKFISWSFLNFPYVIA